MRKLDQDRAKDYVDKDNLFEKKTKLIVVCFYCSKPDLYISFKIGLLLSII